jgi:hypothetical protein
MRRCIWEADLAAVALDALSADELKAARQHAATCRACDQILTEYAQAVAVLATSVVQVQPPPELKRKVFRAIPGDRVMGMLRGRVVVE